MEENFSTSFSPAEDDTTFLLPAFTNSIILAKEFTLQKKKLVKTGQYSKLQNEQQWNHTTLWESDDGSGAAIVIVGHVELHSIGQGQQWDLIAL